MAYVIAEPCIGTKDTACADVCPVDAISIQKKMSPDRVRHAALYQSGRVYLLRHVRSGLSGIGNLCGGRSASGMEAFYADQCGAVCADEEIAFPASR